jgi:hypothetical protein
MMKASKWTIILLAIIAINTCILVAITIYPLLLRWWLLSNIHISN